MTLLSLFSPRKTSIIAGSRRRRPRTRLFIELLEDRAVPSVTLWVTNTCDDNGVDPAPFAGTGTLRQAIIDAYYESAPAVIAFAIPTTDAGYNSVTGTFRIQPKSALPTIGWMVVENNPVTIDGTTQPGYTNHPLIELNGALAGTASGLDCSGNFDTIKGLDINSFSGYGIYLRSENNTVTGCYIGTDVMGTQPQGNQGAGIFDYGGRNTIGGLTDTPGTGAGNVISANGSPQGSFPGGVVLSGGNSVVEGNLIGLTADGNSALGNSLIAGGPYTLDNTAIADVVVMTDNNTIGGPSPGARNVISGCTDGDGIQVEAQVTFGATLQGVVIQGNYIGTNRAGNARVANEDGVGLYARGPIGTGIIGTLVERNLISGNNRYGVLVTGADGTMITGNYIGTDKDGSSALGNGDDGVDVDNSNTVVGGTAAGAGNLIGANGAYGVEIRGMAAQGTQGCVVQGNLIGTNSAGSSLLGNALDGVLIHTVYSDASNNTIGGTAPGAANIIADNAGAGVGINLGNPYYGAHAYGNHVQGNSIYANRVGIDLGDGGTPVSNDALGHSGPNNYQNFPLIASVLTNGTSTTITGTFSEAAEPNTTITLDFYANAAPDRSGYFEGQTYLGSAANIPTDSNGNASFSVTLPVAVTPGAFVTATATDQGGNTSEFSPDFQTPLQVDSVTVVSASANPSVLNQSVTFTATVTPAVPNRLTPTGTVQFQIDGNKVPGTFTLNSGTASFPMSALTVGTHTITALYSGDGSFLGSTGSLTQTILSAQQQDTTIVNQVNSLVSASVLSSGNGSALTTKLNSATASLNAGNTTAGVNQLNAFINQVNAFQKSGKLTSTQAQALIAAANLAIAAAQGSGARLLNDPGSGASANADSQPVTDAGQLVTGTIGVYLDNADGTPIPADEQARFDDAINTLDATFGRYGVDLVDVGAGDAADAVVHVDIAAGSPAGGAADGVLGCTVAGQITLLTGWDWYTGADPSAIGASQYDFQTIVTHELGHALGLGHSGVSGSVMYAYLAPGATRRTVTTQDLSVLDSDSGGMPEPLTSAPWRDRQTPPALHAAVFPASTVIVSQIADPGSGGIVLQTPKAAGQKAFPAGTPASRDNTTPSLLCGPSSVLANSLNSAIPIMTSWASPFFVHAARSGTGADADAQDTEGDASQPENATGPVADPAPAVLEQAVAEVLPRANTALLEAFPAAEPMAAVVVDAVFAAGASDEPVPVLPAQDGHASRGSQPADVVTSCALAGLLGVLFNLEARIHRAAAAGDPHDPRVAGKSKQPPQEPR
jgi:hypothetical protein